ncbi:type III secretion system (T3SS) SseB-like protein [Amycolatopsis sulphurea]|uniref:Type III secretion system (T3SS) SseB-like protein n=1 Tax=Amycolatopsis sulphurea TaxID=76022 RepID=A0A2A9FA65_9PSEU|nr:SseB family protein [Amycolatopsis sulphurea]PFG47661.1 type III secretion system (T3SS) SseB-like protein [Amycolatopsis sulphurea]
MTGLTAWVGHVRAGRGGAGEMVAEFRETVVHVPTDRHGEPLASTADGIEWVYAFTSQEELRRWAAARGEDSVQYLTTRGHRLLDVPAARPTGVALDVAGEAPMLLPPAQGIVSPARVVVS